MLRLLQAIGQLQIGILVGWLLRLLCPRCGDTDKQEPRMIFLQDERGRVPVPFGGTPSC